MKKYPKVIGLVLSNVPGYTETFFRNKIKGLQSKGYSVVLFVDYDKPDDSKFFCEVISANKFKGSLIRTILNFLSTFFRTICIHPKQSFKHFILDRKDGLSIFRSLKNVLLHEHFFNYDLDWLHFGYGMLAHNRENVAQAIEAKMGVSFRGFDLYLSPL